MKTRRVSVSLNAPPKWLGTSAHAALPFHTVLSLLLDSTFQGLDATFQSMDPRVGFGLPGSVQLPNLPSLRRVNTRYQTRKSKRVDIQLIQVML
ncbi:hypothetical protein SLA2020_517480 [Shorea laevis]